MGNAVLYTTLFLSCVATARAINIEIYTPYSQSVLAADFVRTKLSQKPILAGQFYAERGQHRFDLRCRQVESA